MTGPMDMGRARREREQEQREYEQAQRQAPKPKPYTAGSHGHMPGGAPGSMSERERKFRDQAKAAGKRKQDNGGTAGQNQAAQASDDGRKEIHLAEERFNQILRECARLLRDTIYLRGTAPFVITRAADAGTGRKIKDRDGAGVEIAGVRYRPGSLVFAAATPDRAALRLDDLVLFRKFDKRSETWEPATCNAKLVQRLVGAASDLGFRSCAGISRAPLFLDGEIVAASGWNAETTLILDPPAMPAIPDRPTKRDAYKALDRLLRPFRGYLADNADLRPVLATAALTAALRPSLPTAPAIVLDGNTPGAGKGRAARALATIAVGGLPAVIFEGHNDEETEKRIAAAIMQGAPAVLLDNMQRRLASTALESILTDPIARIRKFGSLSDDVTTECRALVLITANNATLRRDLLRRTLPVRIVVPYENPERRHFGFDPVDEARRDRGELLVAAFTIARAWHLVRERPRHAAIRDKTLGSFEAWADLVAGAVEWLTGANPIDVIEARKESDHAAASERGMIAQLAHAFPNGERFTAAEAVTKIDPETWRTVLSFKAEKPTGRAVGYWLRHRKDRCFGLTDHAGISSVATLKTDGLDRNSNTIWLIDTLITRTQKQGNPRDTDDRAGDAGDVPSARGKNGSDSDTDTFGEWGSNITRITRTAEPAPDDLEFYE